MVTAELDPAARRAVHSAVWCTAALWAITAVGALAGALAPSLAASTAPHPTIHPSLAAGAAILVSNTRVIALPLLLVAFGFASRPVTRLLGDLAVTVLFGANAARVGLEIGRWQQALVPYLPHLPLEWAGLGVAASSWRQARNGAAGRHAWLIPTATTSLALLIAGAAVETLLTPHAAPIRSATTVTNRQASSPRRDSRPGERTPSTAPLRCDPPAGGSTSPIVHRGLRPVVASRSLALPSPRGARFRFGRPGAFRSCSTTHRNPTKEEP